MRIAPPQDLSPCGLTAFLRKDFIRNHETFWSIFGTRLESAVYFLSRLNLANF